MQQSNNVTESIGEACKLCITALLTISPAAETGASKTGLTTLIEVEGTRIITKALAYVNAVVETIIKHQVKRGEYGRNIFYPRDHYWSILSASSQLAIKRRR